MKIFIGPSFCKVEGTVPELSWVHETLCFDVPGAKYTNLFKRGQWDGKKRMFNRLTRAFPVGLLFYVLRAGKTLNIELVDNRKFPVCCREALTLNTIELREYQIRAINACFTQKNGIVEAATNAGKTAIFSGLIKTLYPAPTLVLTHMENLLDQTVDYISTYTGFECGFIKANSTKIRPVTVAMIKTLINRIGVDQEVTDYFESLKCVIQDEVHHAEAKQFTDVLSACPAPYRFGFSGTIPPANEYKGVLVRQFFGDVIFKISNDELIDMNVSAKPKIFVYEIDVTERVHGVYAEAKAELTAEDELFSGQELMKRVYKKVVEKGIVNNEERNGKTVDIIRSSPEKSVLIVVDFIEHGEIVERTLTGSGIPAVFISGKSAHRTKALADFKAGCLKVLISTSIVDEGLDISRIETLVLLAGKKSRRQLLQRIGRSLRRKEGENTVSVFDFVDMGQKYLLKHSKERLAIYKQEQFEVAFM